MMIEDEELRTLYKTSSEEHLQNLEAGLLHLEKHPSDNARLQELLREAHTLKGDSRMLGIKDVETLTHQIEHILGTLKESDLSSSVSDRLYRGLDAIRLLVHEAVTGEAAGVNTFKVLAELMGAKTQAPPQLRSDPQPKTDDTVDADRPSTTTDSEPTPLPHIVETTNNTTAEPKILPANVERLHIKSVPITAVAASAKSDRTELIKPPPNGKHNLTPATATLDPVAHDTIGDRIETPPAATSTNNYRIDTIRVETRNLDALMTQAGELTVTKIRIAHRLAQIEELLTMWEEWSRDTSVNRKILDFENPGGTGVPLHNGAINHMQNFHHRSNERLEKLGVLVNRLRNSATEDVARLEAIGTELESGIRTLRLLPLSTIFNLFPRLVRDLARQQGKEIDLVIEGGDTKADKRILEEMKDPLMHLLRNCVDRGIETPAEREKLGKPRVATLRLVGYQTGDSIVIEVGDNGRGLDIEKIKQTAQHRGICRAEELDAMTPRQIQSLIFAPGFSTRTVVSEVSRSGVGLDVVRTNVERLKGNIQVESIPGKGCTFRLQLGTSLTTVHVMLVEVAGISYALPIEFVQTTQLLPEYEILNIEGRDTIIYDGEPVSIARLADLLELDSLAPAYQTDAKTLACVILKVGNERLALVVDALLDEQDVILKPQSKLLKRVRNVAGATILGTGEVCMILNSSDLIKSVNRKDTSVVAPLSDAPEVAVADVKTKPLILLAEDSIAIRTQEKRILESAGYEVVTAVDGLDGFNKLKTRAFDAVVSDVQMPNMDGLTLAAKIRQNKEYNELPIILVTSLASDEDKRRGAEAGANAYITKGTFNQELLLETLKRLV